MARALSLYLCRTAKRAGDCGRLRLPGLKLGLGSGLLAQLCGQRGEPFVAPPAFLRAARVDRAYPPSGPRAPRPSADRQASFPFHDYISAPTASSAVRARMLRWSERYARDARAAELMRPWTEEIATQQAWEAALGVGAQRGSAVGA